MRTLIVEDDFTSRRILQKFLEPYGETNIAVNGQEAVEAFRMAMEEGNVYDLICLDIMMPEMDGHQVLDEIRGIEEKHGVEIGGGVKIIMTTALVDSDNVLKSFKGMCDAYMTKPVDREELEHKLEYLELTGND